MSVGADVAQALARLDWPRLATLLAPDAIVTIMGDWACGGATDLAGLRSLGDGGRAGLPPLALAGDVRRIVDDGAHAAAEIAAVSDYAMFITVTAARATHIALYFDVLAYTAAGVAENAGPSARLA